LPASPRGPRRRAPRRPSPRRSRVRSRLPRRGAWFARLTSPLPSVPLGYHFRAMSSAVQAVSIWVMGPLQLARKQLNTASSASMVSSAEPSCIWLPVVLDLAKVLTLFFPCTHTTVANCWSVDAIWLVGSTSRWHDQPLGPDRDVLPGKLLRVCSSFA